MKWDRCAHFLASILEIKIKKNEMRRCPNFWLLTWEMQGLDAKCVAHHLFITSSSQLSSVCYCPRHRWLLRSPGDFHPSVDTLVQDTVGYRLTNNLWFVAKLVKHNPNRSLSCLESWVPVGGVVWQTGVQQRWGSPCVCCTLRGPYVAMWILCRTTTYEETSMLSFSPFHCTNLASKQDSNLVSTNTREEDSVTEGPTSHHTP